jgi:hypothetical protein
MINDEFSHSVAPGMDARQPFNAGHRDDRLDDDAVDARQQEAVDTLGRGIRVWGLVGTRDRTEHRDDLLRLTSEVIVAHMTALYLASNSAGIARRE